MSMDYMLNPDKYHVAPPRLDGEKDEQYKLRLRAYSMGMQSQQAKIDELQARIDEALKSADINFWNSSTVKDMVDILKGNKDD